MVSLRNLLSFSDMLSLCRPEYYVWAGAAVPKW